MSLEIRKKLAIVGATGVVFAGGIVGLSSLASAQTPTVGNGAEQQEISAEEAIEIDTGYDLFSADDQELIVEFEDCLSDAGFGPRADVAEGDDIVESTEEFTEEDFEEIDAAFENCEVILDDLSFDAEDWLEAGDLSEEDEAVFEDYDNCIEDAFGADLDEEGDVEWTEQDEERFLAAAESCDAILENLSEEAVLIEGDWDDFGDLSEADEAVLDEYDECISNIDGIVFELDEANNGNDFNDDFNDEVDVEVELTEAELAELEEGFEACDAILENLSEDAGFIFDCEELEEYEDHGEDYDDDIVESVLEA